MTQHLPVTRPDVFISVNPLYSAPDSALNKFQMMILSSLITISVVSMAQSAALLLWGKLRLLQTSRLAAAASTSALRSVHRRWMTTTAEKTKDEERFRWKDMPFQAISIAVGIGTLLYQNQKSEELELRRNNLAYVNNQLSKLYGPLYGNRLANQKSYKEGLLGRENLVKYLQEAERKWRDPETRDEGVQLLTRWRKFLFYVMHPLDLKAEEIIRDNAHLFEYGVEEAELFVKFVVHVNHEKLIVANWHEKGEVIGNKEEFEEGDFSRERNGGKSDGKTFQMFVQLVRHVKETYEKLVERKRSLVREIEERGGY
ncbi:Hypp5705 [Branchiostoma lanceolatum]|uniref:Hypp5705 protein n=1 Tax=Branchiostoma lanceolatum TaxID=7740 RepID=A0A8J9VJR2_BRALA|nr:Hypp5705 [Branchiostoma lanceolatum]